MLFSLTRAGVLDLFSKYRAELPELHEENLGRWGAYDDLERHILYMIIREEQPELVFEASPESGWTTIHIAAALIVNGHGHCFSFEINDVQGAKDRLRNHGGAGAVTFIQGDFRDTAKPLLELLKSKIDILFMDSDHSEEFAKYYTGNIVPKIKPNGLLHVHDIYLPKEDRGDPEGRYIKKFLQDKNWQRIYTRELLQDEDFMKELAQIYSYKWRDQQNPSVWIRLP